jgi:hypothetical protein
MRLEIYLLFENYATGNRVILTTPDVHDAATTLGDERKTSNGSGMRSVRGIAP